MIRLSHFLMVSVLTTSTFTFPSAYADKNATEAITQAEQDLKFAVQYGAVWRLVDRATGSSAVGIDKLLRLARKKLDEGRDDEANRLAKRVSWAARLGLSQAKEQKHVKPYY